jgi:isoleucyl-tRNA synthetase
MNALKTDLPAVPNFPEMEKETIKYWEDIDVVELLKKARKDSPLKTYYDGPITANNMPHYGHTVQWTLKDLVPRYWSMKNYFVTRNMGWDCQGIPVEYEIEKELGFTEKKDIEKYGVEKFNKLCRESVLKYRDSIFYYETRLGRWFDKTDMYYTMDAPYIESMWWSLKELYEKGLLYEGYVVVAYSTRAGTTLSTHEVNSGGYREIEDYGITVKFQQKDVPNRYFLAWTTTPWTMPGNLLLGVGENIVYVIVSSQGSEYILTRSKVEEFFKDLPHEIISTQLGKDLEGLEYLPVYSHYSSKRSEGAFKVVLVDHATEEEGTGIVHLAPYGAEDFEILQKLNISLFDYLDDQAHFTNEVPEYFGMFYKQANEKIMEDLVDQKNLFKKEKVLHKVPICWRTDTPLIYRPIKSWYIAVTKIRDRLIAQNKTVNWVPEHVGTGRMETWLENVRDWALSRSRYWGTPLPLWINDSTGEKVFIGSFAELEKLSGVKIEDPHKPFVDEIIWEDRVNGGTFRRTPDVIDVWYDSGSMPFAQYHYPFENQDFFKQKFPADYVVEMYEQARLWFYTLLVINTALFDRVPYRNVVAHGVMLAKDGKKLSKSKRNFPPMDEVLDTFGGDILRYFILTSPIVEAEGARFYSEALEDVKKEFFLLLWNSARYFLTYANLFNFKPSLEKPTSENVLDKWILTRLQETVNTIITSMDTYQIMNASRALGPFVNDLSTWYIRRSRDRLNSGDKEALWTLYYVLTQYTKLVAPMLPFISENLYGILGIRELTGLPSVHLDLFPVVEEISVDEIRILEKMEYTRKIVTSALSIRNTVNIGIKQPLGELALNGDVYEDLLMDEVNVREINHILSLEDSLFIDEGAEISHWVSAEDGLTKIDITITPELELEGAERLIISSLQAKRKKAGLNMGEKVVATIPSKDLLKKALKKYESELKNAVGATEINLGKSYAVEKV